MSFPEHVTNRKVVDNGLYYLNTDCQPNRDKITREKWPKTLKNGQKWPKMAQNMWKMRFSAKSGLTNVVRIGLN